MDPALSKPQGRLTGRAESVANIFPTLLADLESEDIQKRVIAAEELVLYQEHLQATHLQRLVPEFRGFLLKDLEETADPQLSASAASFFAPLAELEQPSVEHPPQENEAGLEARPDGGWVAALLEWGAVPALVTLLNWPSQSDTSPWPGAYAAAGMPLSISPDLSMPRLFASFFTTCKAGGCGCSERHR